jgi:hypothetical protein
MDTFSPGAYGYVMPDAKPQICWICRKPVPLKSVPDEFGFFAHEECIAKQKAKAARG